VIADGPTTVDKLASTIDGIRLYLRKMHGVHLEPLLFDSEAGSDAAIAALNAEISADLAVAE
jgi:hypothetical protein